MPYDADAPKSAIPPWLARSADAGDGPPKISGNPKVDDQEICFI